jgi:TolB protein
MNNDGSAQTNLTKNPADDAFPAWSPDDTQIAFTSKRDAANYELYVINADGSQVMRLTKSLDDKSFPVWTPDGRLAFNGGRLSAGAFRWYLVNADGSDITELEQLRLAGAVNTIDWLL